MYLARFWMILCWMSLKWGGQMNKMCVYYCEGEDDQKLIDALKIEPYKILPGKSKKLNVVQNLILLREIVT